MADGPTGTPVRTLAHTGAAAQRGMLAVGSGLLLSGLALRTLPALRRRRTE
ncbi:hypothetical protein [Motilibacter peucedani]|uniref:hypothetical protein n=1 Tax=Motilibacter peucedani TaxID=598650 RepID=UPI0016021671|nr:hypothetical protein [Motilibacter peucedani]